MSEALLKATQSRAPNDVGRTANDFGVLVFTCAAAHRADALPDHWKGRRIGVQPIGGDADIAFSANANAEVDTSAAASDAGTAAKAGRTVTGDTTEYFVLPDPDGKTLYFVREGAATSIRLHLASGY